MVKDQEKMNLLERAEKYVDLGFSVIPLKQKDKRPLMEWKEYIKRFPTKNELRQWFSSNPTLNMAVVTGSISNVIVVDIDPKNGGDESMKQLHLPPTYIVKTGKNGWHYYYRWQYTTLPPNRKAHLPGVDIQGEKAYVVAASSIHPNGKLYEAITSMDDISNAPEWLFELGKTSSEKLWKNGASGVSVGKRNETAASICGKLLSSLPEEFWEAEGWAALCGWNSTNEQPLPEKELRSVFESIKERADENTNDGKKPTIAKQIVNLVLQKQPLLFHDSIDIPFARIKIDDHDEIYPIKSQRFSRWIVREYWNMCKKPPKNENVRQALEVLSSLALFDGRKITLYNRVAESENSLWYDLANKKWQAIKISQDGWDVVDSPPTLFKRYKHQIPQIYPEKGGELSMLLKYVNISDAGQHLLFLVYIVSCFIPDIPHPIPVLYGGQGAAKSTFLRIARRLIDPSSVELLSFPTQQNELVQQLSHHWAPFYDNVTWIPPWLSDALCRAVTGEGSTKRELYSDDEDIIYRFRCCIGLNGINIVAQRPDLLDRSILFGLERIPHHLRKPEKSFWETFEQSLPMILGSIFDVLVKAISIRPKIELQFLPRMADFALWGCAISEALGYSQEEFLDAYQKNIAQQNEEAIREHPVAMVITELMSKINEWSGTATELLSELNYEAEKLKIDTRQHFWPKAPQALSRRLNEVKSNLETVGIFVDIGRGTNRKITIEKRGYDKDGNDDISEQQEPAVIQQSLTEKLTPNKNKTDIFDL